MIRIVADDKIPFLKGALEGVATVDYIPGAEISNSDLLKADGLITRTRTRCDRKLLEGTGVRFITSATIGHDHIDTAYCQSAGIGWTNAPGCNSASVRQYIISTLLYLVNLRDLDPRALTLGVIGVGNVGSKVAAAAKALGMNVLLNDPPRKRVEGGNDFVEISEILERARIITIHVPLQKGGEDNTFRMVNREFLQGMGSETILINTSRGEVVEELALLEGIREGRLSDVVLDVFENEPGINRQLLDYVTLATPHIAGYSLDGKANGTTMAVRAMSRFFNLGMDQWEPGSIPKPVEADLFGDASRTTPRELLWEIYRQSYDVTLDDGRLREDPGAFEQLRGDYPFRREPQAYSVRLFQGYREITEILERLGFSVLADYCA